MPLRRLTLEEWFLGYQLEATRKKNFILPMPLAVDVTRLNRHFLEQGEKPPYTALIIKAIGLTAVRHPEINRVGFRGLFRKSILQMPHVSLNLPIILKSGDRSILTAAMIPRIDHLSVKEIREQIKNEKSKDPNSLPIAGFLIRKKNNLLNRLILRIIHTGVFNLPGLYEKKGGGLTFSSLLHLRDESAAILPIAYGPTAVSFCASSLSEDSNGRTTLYLGVSWDHFVLHGAQMIAALTTLSKILGGQDFEGYSELIRHS